MRAKFICLVLAGLLLVGPSVGLAQTTGKVIRPGDPEWAEMVEKARTARQPGAKLQIGQTAINGQSAATKTPDPGSIGMQAGPRLPGTAIVYDTGVPTFFFSSGAPGAAVIGNQFNSAITAMGTMVSPVVATGSITMISLAVLYPTPPTINSVAAVFFGPLTTAGAGTMAPGIAIAVFFVPGPIPVVAVFTPGAPIAHTGGSFLGGIRNFNIATTATAITTPAPLGEALTVGGPTVPQGFHGMVIGFPTVGTMGFGFGSIPSRNIFFRVAGDVAVPVELIDFKIKE